MAKIDFQPEIDFKEIDFKPGEGGISKPPLTVAQKVLPQFITGATFQPGQRTVLGDIFERPGAAIRATLMRKPGENIGQAYTRGATYPETVPSFQSKALDAYYGKDTSLLGRKVNPLLKETFGYGLSATGLLADIATNPADVLTTVMGKTPVPKFGTLGNVVKQTIGQTKPILALERFGNKERYLPFTQPDEIKLTKAVEQGFKKAVRPSVVGKSTANQSQKYYDRAESAVKSIVDNKEILKFTDNNGELVNRLPKTVEETSSAVGQVKKHIFDKYDTLAKEAGQEGASVGFDNAINRLDTIANSKVLRDIKPDVADYAAELSKRLKRRGRYTAQEAQDAIELYNNSLKSFYKNPSYVDAHRAAIDAQVAAILRSDLDNAITKYKGPGYSDLKKEYGALKTVEKDITHRATVLGRQNIKGLIDFTDILSTGDFVRGLISMNPAEMARGGAMYATKQLIKRVNNPDRIIANMFSKADKIISKQKPVIPFAKAEIVSNPPKNIPSPWQTTSKMKMLPAPRDITGDISSADNIITNAFGRGIRYVEMLGDRAKTLYKNYKNITKTNISYDDFLSKNLTEVDRELKKLIRG